MLYFKNPLQLGALNDTQNFIPVQKLRFETFIGQSKGPVIELDMLTEIYKQDFLKWTDQLKLVIRRCKITSTEEQNDMLQMAVDPKYHSLISSGCTINTKIDNLKTLVFNEENYVYLKDFLKRMKLTKYDNIDNYTESFLNIVEK
ncbi:hypothetical protein A0H76_1986 [Hepatospora eriocheir]|uniref:Uncharacterized protein n=1 Tax=Hepatospora eriocheir TaxID=1081669 RepID=A0A1X0QG44_9MICR|nr:hypothetical protein A0H76_1986 [Hepatospora eriocheir]